jgi:octaprenyl-diphosphate synthase
MFPKAKVKIVICLFLEQMKGATDILKSELAQFESAFKVAVKSQVPLLDRIMRFIVNRKGKQLRPMFVLLSAKLCGGVTDSSYRAASLVELLHTATLVHDDVVDESPERRNFFSPYALWKSKVSVLVGDYLLAKGLLLSLDNNDFRILQILSQAVRQMSEGELLQIEKSRTLNIREEDYYEIIMGKTASLLAAACAAGAYSATSDEKATEQMRSFGEKVGMAFQIKDDLFDYGNEGIGKPTGNDIKEKKLTLPLIYTLNQASRKTRNQIIHTLKNNHKDRKKIAEVIQFVKDNGGIDYARNKMFTFRDEAMEILRTFDNPEVTFAMEDLVRFTTDRSY